MWRVISLLLADECRSIWQFYDFPTEWNLADKKFFDWSSDPSLIKYRKNRNIVGKGFPKRLYAFIFSEFPSRVVTAADTNSVSHWAGDDCKSLISTSVRVLTQHRLVGGGIGERGSSKTNTLIGGIVDGIEALEEGHTVDEVETLTGVRTEIADDQVDVASSTTDLGVEGTGPDLSIGGQLKGSL